MIDGSALANYFGSVIIWFFVAGAVFAASLIFGVPWIWSIIKPYIHAITA